MRILIAEDDITSRQLLSVVLQRLGHEIVATQDGESAYRALLEKGAPQLAILDLMMPRLDGLEVCRRVRGDGIVPRPYLLVLTAIAERSHLVAALDAGADDYMTKPFDRNELRARVAVASRVIEAENRLREENQRLEDLVEERAKLLLHADRMATVGTLAAGIAHEINNPATFIGGNVGVLEQCVAILRDHFASNDAAVDERIEMVLAELPKIGAAMRNGVSRIEAIVNGLRVYSRRTELTPLDVVDLEKVIEAALELCHNRLKLDIELERTHLGGAAKVRGNEQQLVQVFVNLIVNAIDAMEGKEGRLAIETDCRDGRAKVRVEDSGPGIGAELRSKIFDPFFTTKSLGKGTGLGLAITKTIVEAHGGSIYDGTSRWGGASLTVDMPIVTSTINQGAENGN